MYSVAKPFGAYSPVTTIAFVDDPHARTGNDALIDRLLEPDVGVAGALGAEIAHAREAGQQLRARMVHRARDAQRERLVEHLIVPRRLVVRMQQQMRVPFDQAREAASCRAA